MWHTAIFAYCEAQFCPQQAFVKHCHMHTRAHALLYQQKNKHQGHIKGINPLYSKGEGVSLLAVQRAQNRPSAVIHRKVLLQSPLPIKATEIQKQTRSETQITTIRDGN